jgi:diguanylate cyclase (GGDEF)-like protein
MSINLKLILGCMAFALFTIAFAVVSQRAHVDLHSFFAQDLAPRQQSIRDLQDGQRRAALLEAVLSRGAATGPDQALSDADRALVDDAVKDMLASAQAAGGAAVDGKASPMRDTIVNALLRLQATGGDMTLRLALRETAKLTEAFDAATARTSQDLEERQDQFAARLEAASRDEIVFLGATLAGVMALAFFLSRSLVHRVRQATATIAAMAGGNLARQRTTDSTREFAALHAALETLRTGIVQQSQSQERLLLSQATSFGTTLETHQNQFGAALNNMTQGLCMLDAGLNLIVFNEPFSRLFSNFKLGAPAQEVLADPRFHHFLAPHETGMFVHEMPSGQLLQVKRRGVRGGGLVITFDDVTEQHKTSQRLEHLAGHDALTGLANRSRFRDTLQEALGDKTASGQLAVVYLDLNGFKSINDIFGHLVGDALLQAVGRRLVDIVPPGDRVARLGGDEFAIIQNSGGQPEAAEDLAAAILKAFEIPFEVDGRQVTIGLSMGISVNARGVQDAAATADTVMQNCDLALHDAKVRGSEDSDYRFYAPHLREQLLQRRAMEGDLRHALKRGELELAYQPFVDADRAAVSGFEALLRWRHPVKGMIPPNQFIPIAESIGLITEIGLWALKTACAEAAGWPGDLAISVNLSPVQFKSKTLVDDVTAALRDAGLSPRRLQLEVTESLFIDQAEDVLATLTALRRLGTRISMDDFGTGYSSLGYLTRFPFDKIKIDQSFVRDIDKPESLAVIRAVIGLSHSMKMAVIAEGVETPAQYQLLHREGCREMQGYLFSKPQPASALPTLLMRIPLDWPMLTEETLPARPRRLSLA